MSHQQDLVDLLETAIANHGPRELFGTKRHGQWHWISFAEFGRQIDDFRAGLALRGIRRGSRVACISNNRVEWAIAAYACYGLGAVFVPLYEAQLDQEWRYVLEDSGAELLVVSTRAIYDRTRGWVGEAGRLAGIVLMDAPADDPASFGAVMRAGARRPVPAVHMPPEAPCGFIYTSGTTGMPKGVVLTHGNIVSNVTAFTQLFDIGPADRTLSFLPWSHCYGQTAELHTMIAKGVSMALNDSVDRLIDNLAEVRPTIVLCVPRIFNRIYERVQKQLQARPALVRAMVTTAIAASDKRRRGKALTVTEKLAMTVADRLVFSKVRQRFGGRLRFAISGGAALSQEVAEFLLAIGIIVYEGYGLTETAPVIATNAPGRSRVGTVGKPVPTVTVKIRPLSAAEGADGRAVSTPEDSPTPVGEIVCYGPNVMKGYYNLPAETAATFTDDGGFRTGDLGYVDYEGYLHITGRVKEQYKLENGRYVVPAPLEEQLKLSPFIASIMVYGHDRPHNVALIAVERLELEAWAETEGIAVRGEALLDDPRVVALYRGELDRLGRALRSYERVQSFALTLEDFTVNNGLLTPKLSVRRHAVLAKYKPVLEALYPARDSLSPRAGI